jgi:hypothetical protein
MTYGLKTYQINMTFPQMCVIYELNKNGPRTANQLSEKIKIPSMNVIGMILNSLTMTKLITREAGELTNPNIPYFINKSFSFLSDKVSIVGVYEKLSNPQKKTIAPKRDDVKLNMMIVKSIMDVPEMTIDEIMIKLLENDKMQLKSVGVYTIENVQYLVNKLVRDKYVVENQNKYKYIDNENSCSDTESDEEIETENNMKVIVTKKNKNIKINDVVEDDKIKFFSKNEKEFEKNLKKMIKLDCLIKKKNLEKMNMTLI